jgi:phage shock protein A
MRKLIAIAGFVVLASCGSKDKTEQFISDYESLKNKLCACKDKECAAKAKEAADKHERSAEEKGVGKPTEAQEARFEKIEDQVNECANKYEGAAPP